MTFQKKQEKGQEVKWNLTNQNKQQVLLFYFSFFNIFIYMYSFSLNSKKQGEHVDILKPIILLRLDLVAKFMDKKDQVKRSSNEPQLAPTCQKI